MFPQGGPGLALLLLRISVATIFLVSSITAANQSGMSSMYLLSAGISLIALSLSIGFLTPYLSAIAVASAVANLLVGFHSGNLIALFHICAAAALALLGPGAYSVDARLFGRRVTVLPPRKDTNRF